MAKKKAPKTMNEATKERRAVAITLKGSEEWKGWVEMVAGRCRITVSSLIDLALTDFAKGKGIQEEPPER